VSTTSSLVGQTLGHYRLVARVSNDPWGRCYLAERFPASGQRELALITFLSTLKVEEQSAWQAFSQCIEQLKSLQHPFLMPILEAGRDAECIPYLVSPYETTRSLETLMRQHASHPFPPAQARLIIDQIGQALHYLHNQGWWYGNLTARVVDLAMDGTVRLWISGMAALYQAARREQADPPELHRLMERENQRADQYALAALAYHLCTGHLPFSSREGLQQARTLVAPSTLVPGFPTKVEQALLKALAPEPGRRFESIPAFLLALAAQA